MRRRELGSFPSISGDKVTTMMEQEKEKKPKNEKTPLTVEKEESRKARAPMPLPPEPINTSRWAAQRLAGNRRNTPRHSERLAGGKQ